MSAAIRIITITEDTLREIIREELSRARPVDGADADAYVSVPKAAAGAGIAKETVRSYIHAGRVPYKLAGREYRVRLADVLAAMEPQPAREVDSAARTKEIIRRLRG